MRKEIPRKNVMIANTYTRTGEKIHTQHSPMIVEAFRKQLTNNVHNECGNNKKQKKDGKAEIANDVQK